MEDKFISTNLDMLLDRIEEKNFKNETGGLVNCKEWRQLRRFVYFTEMNTEFERFVGLL
jgi:hypothetical protein